jgi:hypothetical protein
VVQPRSIIASRSGMPYSSVFTKTQTTVLMIVRPPGLPVIMGAVALAGAVSRYSKQMGSRPAPGSPRWVLLMSKYERVSPRNALGILTNSATGVWRLGILTNSATRVE